MAEKNNKIRKDSEALRDFLNQFEAHDKTYWISQLSEGCMVPRHTVHNWSKGLVRIPALYKIKIEEIIGQEIFDRITEPA
jgi:predicted transcriptional regulator